MAELQDPLQGNVVGGCRLERRLATGGMGVVYIGRSKKTGEEVAVKILAPALANDAEYVERFFREAVAAETLDHPNVVKVLDAGTDLGRHYMVLEFVRGRTLGDHLAEMGRLNLEAATRIARDIARGLEAAHAAGIIHRDIKPANILMAHDGTPRITDFGLARTGTRRSAITLEGVFMGTPEYVSPEQAEGGEIDHRGDLYSLGVCYYQMLSGQFPFYGKTAMEMAMARLHHEPRPLEHALPGVDSRAAAVVRRLLRKNPKDRYQNATELIADLDALLLGKTPAAARARPTTHARERWTSLALKRALRAAVFGLLLLTAMTCLAAFGTVARGRIVPVRLGLRETLLLAGLTALLGSFFIFRRELSASGRAGRVVFFLTLAAAGAGSGALFLRGAAAGDSLFALETTGRALGRALRQPVHALFGALTLAVLAIGLAWPRYAGLYRYLLFRVLLASSVVLLYLFAVGGDWAAPFRSFRRTMDFLLPLGTGAAVTVVFGIELSVGYAWGERARALGLVLLALGAVAILAFGWAGSCVPGRSVDWADLLASSARRFAADFRGQAGPMGVSHPLLALALVTYLHGKERSERRSTSHLRNP